METNGQTKYSKRIPIDVIKKCVSDASFISIAEMELPNSWPLARKRERVNAREMSMALSKDYSGKSLAQIGIHHGGRDHATVLHAHKTVNNLLDTKDHDIVDLYRKSNKLIDDWVKKSIPVMPEGLSPKRKTALVKHWIKCHIPLFVRWEILQSIGKKCHMCGQPSIIINYYGNRIKTVSNSL